MGSKNIGKALGCEQSIICILYAYEDRVGLGEGPSRATRKEAAYYA